MILTGGACKQFNADNILCERNNRLFFDDFSVPERYVRNMAFE
ncbi:hypothetical protein HMPREF1141_1023 [Clostridium sp. MSTE9]|nr:hypothetical protein HMPREF1141_1023 [Clostridium sp. MSTE9]